MSSELREIRINPIVPSESVLVATARGNRPKKAEELAPRDSRPHVATCPFCRGNEDKTPPAIQSLPEDENWDIRIVENSMPASAADCWSARSATWPSISIASPRPANAFSRASSTRSSCFMSAPCLPSPAPRR